MERSRGECEWPLCSSRDTEWAHLFGRMHIIPEPWASRPEMTLALCRRHHNAVDRGLDEEMRETLRWRGVMTLAENVGLLELARGRYRDHQWSAVDAARDLVREIEHMEEAS